MSQPKYALSTGYEAARGTAIGAGLGYLAGGRTGAMIGGAGIGGVHAGMWLADSLNKDKKQSAALLKHMQSNPQLHGELDAEYLKRIGVGNMELDSATEGGLADQKALVAAQRRADLLSKAAMNKDSMRRMDILMNKQSSLTSILPAILPAYKGYQSARSGDESAYLKSIGQGAGVGAVTGTAKGMHAAGPLGAIIVAPFGAAGGAISGPIGHAIGRGVGHLVNSETGKQVKAQPLPDKTAMNSESARRFELLSKSAGDLMDRLKKVKDIAGNVAGAVSAAAPAAAEAAVSTGKKVIKGWRDMQATGAPKAAIIQAKDMTGYFKGGSESLTELATQLYREGAVRDSIMEGALQQAAGVKMASQMDQILKLAFLRNAYFGAESPTAAKIAAGQPEGPVDKLLGGLGGGAGQGLAKAVLQAGEAGYRWLTNKTPQKVEESYQSLMKSNPDFEHKKDVVRGHFDVLKTYAPSIAQNPLAAAGHIRQSMEMGQMIPVDTIHKLVQTEKLHQEAGVAPSIFR